MTLTSPLVRPLRVTDFSEARLAHRELAAEDFEFLLSLPGDLDAPEAEAWWPDYLADLAAHERGERLPSGWVPASFRVAEVDGQVAGRISIRHTVEGSEHLSSFGGHLGYGVRPAFRRRGVATALLRAGLAEVGRRGVTHALAMCDDDNVASAGVIEACGGDLRDVIDVDLASCPSGRWRRYTIATS